MGARAVVSRIAAAVLVVSLPACGVAGGSGDADIAVSPSAVEGTVAAVESDPPSPSPVLTAAEPEEPNGARVSASVWDDGAAELCQAWFDAVNDAAEALGRTPVRLDDGEDFDWRVERGVPLFGGADVAGCNLEVRDAGTAASDRLEVRVIEVTSGASTMCGRGQGNLFEEFYVDEETPSFQEFLPGVGFDPPGLEAIAYFQELDRRNDIVLCRFLTYDVAGNTGYADAAVDDADNQWMVIFDGGLSGQAPLFVAAAKWLDRVGFEPPN